MMKNAILRTCVALACAASLASCGGDNTGTLILGGTVRGVTQDGLVVQNNGGSDLSIPANATTYRFKDLVPTDSVYNITFKSIPDNTESCNATPAQGNTGLYGGSVAIACVIKTRSVTGTVTGLGNRAGLVLSNGPDQVAVTGDGTFTMARVSLGAPYGIAVLKQPENATCTVTNGIGVIADNVANIAVTCVGTGA